MGYKYKKNSTYLQDLPDAATLDSGYANESYSNNKSEIRSCNRKQVKENFDQKMSQRISHQSQGMGQGMDQGMGHQGQGMGQGMSQGMGQGMGHNMGYQGQNYSNQSSAKRYSQELMRQRNLSNNQQRNLFNNQQQNLSNNQQHRRFHNKTILRENYNDKKISVNTCLDICDHIKGCPICSKFYNTDKTIYIVIIIILCLVILVLLKKVLKI